MGVIPGGVVTSFLFLGTPSGLTGLVGLTLPLWALEEEWSRQGGEWWLEVGEGWMCPAHHDEEWDHWG